MAYSHQTHTQRLFALMGSDDVKLNDKRYMQKLKKRIKEDHELKLKQREEALALNEVKREKRLILGGVISAPIDELENTQRRSAERKRRKKRRSSKSSQEGENQDETSTEAGKSSASDRNSRLSRHTPADDNKDVASSDTDTKNKQSVDGDQTEQDDKLETERGKTPSLLYDLQDEESVSGLYAVAEKLVHK
ncbi:uncharacterized protein DDB_G0283697-like isoform X2 [Ptychodera flava]|uniref:uncharacterized protein DDB_G0283697-like isoform X2 n=1 Tax=Ptychodera flava TaxID=63121 RepID=UPI003969E9E7